MADRQGVEIDYCPQCRGVWLDRGELDKIIERSAELEQRIAPPQQQAPPPQQTPPPPPYQQPSYQQPPAQDPYYPNDPHRKGYDPYYKHKKKKGFLGEFFDFD